MWYKILGPQDQELASQMTLREMLEGRERKNQVI